MCEKWKASTLYAALEMHPSLVHHNREREHSSMYGVVYVTIFFFFFENIKTLRSEWKWQNNWTLVGRAEWQGTRYCANLWPTTNHERVHDVRSSCCRNMIWRADLICREFGFVCRTEDFESSMGFSITAGEAFERRVGRGILITEAALRISRTLHRRMWNYYCCVVPHPPS